MQAQDIVWLTAGVGAGMAITMLVLMAMLTLDGRRLRQARGRAPAPVVERAPMTAVPPPSRPTPMRRPAPALSKPVVPTPRPVVSAEEVTELETALAEMLKVPVAPKTAAPLPEPTPVAPVAETVPPPPVKVAPAVKEPEPEPLPEKKPAHKIPPLPKVIPARKVTPALPPKGARPAPAAKPVVKPAESKAAPIQEKPLPPAPRTENGDLDVKSLFSKPSDQKS